MTRYTILMREAAVDSRAPKYLYIVKDKVENRSVAACTSQQHAADVAYALEAVSQARLQRRQTAPLPRSRSRSPQVTEVVRPTALLPRNLERKAP